MPRIARFNIGLFQWLKTTEFKFTVVWKSINAELLQIIGISFVLG